MKFDQEWRTRYEDMIESPRQALSHIQSGHRIFLGTGCGVPSILVEQMTMMARRLADVEIIELLTKGDAPYTEKQYQECFKVNSFFIGHNVLDIYREGRGDYTPVLLSDIPQLFNTGQLPLDVALIQVSPPDERGKMSLGVSVDIVKSAAQNASLVIAQVNPHMPWTRGDSLIDIYDLDILVDGERPLVEREEEGVTEVGQKIGKYVAALIPNGATIEFGMGRIPGVGRIWPMIAGFLGEKKDLGIHTEMVVDEIIDLIERGVVTGMRKTLDRGKVVASFCMGTEKLYKYVNDNPRFSFRPTEYVNDVNVIGKQNRMVAINLALEIDITGQVCSDSDSDGFYSGIGGQVDFNRGAARSLEGRPIIVLPSTNEAGESRIVSRLRKGSGVVITRGTVHYVVTEYGVAYLHGKSIQDRALALISVAHPDNREELLKQAIELKYVRPEFAEVEGNFVVAYQDYMRSSLLLGDGTEILFRPIHPTDEPRMRDLVYDLSQETLYYRFMTHHHRFGQRRIQNFVYVDHRRDVAIVATLPEAYGEEIIAVGRYYLDERTNRAEVAFVARDEWQGKGLGTALFKHLMKIAKISGISGFTAEVLRSNKPMQSIFNNSGCKVSSHMESGVYSFIMDF